MAPSSESLPIPPADGFLLPWVPIASFSYRHLTGFPPLSHISHSLNQQWFTPISPTKLAVILDFSLSLTPLSSPSTSRLFLPSKYTQTLTTRSKPAPSPTQILQQLLLWGSQLPWALQTIVILPETEEPWELCHCPAQTSVMASHHRTESRLPTMASTALQDPQSAYVWEVICLPLLPPHRL